MKASLFVLFVLLSFSSAWAGLLQPRSRDFEWEMFKGRHQKLYDSDDEEQIRRSIWEKNLKLIERHNIGYAIGLHNYKLGANKFADWTNEEFRQQMLMPKRNMSAIQRQPNRDQFVEVEGDDEAVPKAVDWRHQGYVTAVKNQKQCGSCWSFSATGSMEGQHFKKTGKLVSLSEQNLMDCSFLEGNEGCNGGLMDQAFQYVIKNHGVDTETSYPYEARDGRCRFNQANVGATISSYKDIAQGNEKALTAAIAKVGPISVAIDAGHPSFQLYDSGVYDEPACSQTQLDHGVLAVGYGEFNGKAFYIVKNSWGTEWGMSGYVWMSRFKDNQCGIATSASFPLV